MVTLFIHYYYCLYNIIVLGPFLAWKKPMQLFVCVCVCARARVWEKPIYPATIDEARFHWPVSGQIN